MTELIKKYKYFILPICLILILSLSRIVPHPYNFTPILAVGVFSGFYFKKFILGFFVVICSMFIGDLFLGFHGTMFFTYSALSLAVIFGIFIKKFKFKEILLSGIASSICFFIITNLGVWALGTMYEKTFNGLLQSYVMGIPFFHNTLLSTLLYLLVLKLFYDFALNRNLIKIYK